jgi:AraC-like DNA-binding protein
MTADPPATAHHGPASISFEEFGLSAFTFREDQFPNEIRAGRAPIMATHNHVEAELTLIESGGVVLEFSGDIERLGPPEPVLYWGGIPHRVREVTPGSVFHVVQVPLVDLLSWTNATPMLRLLLDGRFLRESSSRDETSLDCVGFARWTRDLRSADWGLRRAATLEIEARLRRFLTRIATEVGSAAHAPSSIPTRRLVAVTRFVADHFTEPITVEDIAAAVGWHRDHLMASFRRFCGLTLWSYVTRLRLAEAQRLLTTTDLPITRICHQAGFGSTSQMYDVFRRHRDTTPARFRRAALAGNEGAVWAGAPAPTGGPSSEAGARTSR